MKMFAQAGHVHIPLMFTFSDLPESAFVGSMRRILDAIFNRERDTF
jgi:hypothetical protein